VTLTYYPMALVHESDLNIPKTYLNAKKTFQVRAQISLIYELDLTIVKM